MDNRALAEEDRVTEMADRIQNNFGKSPTADDMFIVHRSLFRHDEMHVRRCLEPNRRYETLYVLRST
jgi:hypothetical protein